MNFTELPTDLPRPVDDGACDHLPGAALPDLTLPCTDGDTINFRDIEIRKIAKVYYPVFPPDQNADQVVAWVSRRPKLLD